MERTRFFRRPVVWIVLVIIGAIALRSLFTSGQTYTPVNTSDVLAQLDSGNVHKVLIEDKEQTVDLGVNPTGARELVDFLVAIGNSDLMVRVKDLTLNPDQGSYKLMGSMRLVASFQKKSSVGPATVKPTGGLSSARP